MEPWIVNILRSKVTVEEAERQNTDAHVNGGRAFGFLSDKWIRLKQTMEPGDELWWFNSPPEDWEQLRGCQGYCLTRGGKMIAILGTARN